MTETKFNINTNEYLPLRDVVFNTLRDAILTGKLVPGERLMEINWRKAWRKPYPVREALRMLELENLVELVPRKGAQVLDMTEKDIVNILEIRSALEGLATSLACRKMTKECLQQLKNMEVDFERAVAENDVERFVDIDEDFHDVIFQATENDKLIQMFRNLKIQLYRYRMAQAKSDNSMSTIVAHHRSILRALENHDSEEGAAVAQGHIKYQTESILRFIKINKTI